MAFDAEGNLYGVTVGGGTYGWGTLYELTPTADGQWSETVLRNFSGGRDGADPMAGLTFDAAGNLYGVASLSGIYGGGLVFEMSPNGRGGWSFRTLHNFGNRTDGTYPQARLTMDAAGNLYGTTVQGGIFDTGTVFQLSPDGSGGWAYTKIHNFDNGRDGMWPKSAVAVDGEGNVYGVTEQGGYDGHSCSPWGDTHACGTVYKLTPNGTWDWTYKKLHNFWGGWDQQYPDGDVILDSSGNVYGTTSSGWYDYNPGSVFEVIPNE